MYYILLYIYLTYTPTPVFRIVLSRWLFFSCCTKMYILLYYIYECIMIFIY